MYPGALTPASSSPPHAQASGRERGAPMGSAEEGARGPPPTRYTWRSSHCAVWLAGLSSCTARGCEGRWVSIGDTTCLHPPSHTFKLSTCAPSCDAVEVFLHSPFASFGPPPSHPTHSHPYNLVVARHVFLPKILPHPPTHPPTNPPTHSTHLAVAVEVFLHPHFASRRPRLPCAHHHAARPRQLENLCEGVVGVVRV